MELLRLIGIDYGEVRIGIALSDPLQIIAQPYQVIRNDEYKFSRITKIVKEQKVEKIILGLPVNLAGEDTKKTSEIREFAKQLENHVDIPIIFWDERLTSVEANEKLKQMGYSIKDSRKVIDKVAASIILKSYMEEN